MIKETEQPIPQKYKKTIAILQTITQQIMLNLEETVKFWKTYELPTKQINKK